MSIKFNVNGKDFVTERDPLSRLIDVLREELNLTGTKEGCGEGECGACAVLLNGKIINSCLIPIANVENAKVVTIEMYSETEKGKVVANAFLEEGAVQCGYCTPGMVIAAENILSETNGKPTEQQVRTGIAGNLCRCTGYDHIVNAVLRASDDASELWGSK